MSSLPANSAAVLLTAEDTSGKPITEVEVCEFRNGPTRIVLPFITALAVEEDLGYPDTIVEDYSNE